MLKLAFSTLGCPDFSWTDIYSMAKDFGFDGIEIRGLGSEIFAVQAQPFTESQLPQTIKKLSELRIQIPCLSSGCCLKYAEKAEQNHQEIVQYIELASKLGTPYIRILADIAPQPAGEVDDEVVLAALNRLVPLAEEKGVTLLVETNGVYADTSRLCRLLNDVASDNVGALWDMHHPYRFADETPGKTVQNLGAYINMYISRIPL
jgi:Sugar phosphate isomerases/epimerases